MECFDRYCFPTGKYYVTLDDSALYRERVKHAKVVFSSAYGVTTSVTLVGTNTSVYYLGDYKFKKNGDDSNDSKWYETTGFIVGVVVGGFVLLCCIVCIVKYVILAIFSSTLFIFD